MKVAIQGQTGSYHHLAAQKFYAADVEIIPCKTFREAFEMLANGHANQAVVALENSLYGSLNETYDYLLDFKPSIIGEIYLHISFDIFATANARPETITDIYSHPAALGECREYLHKNFPWARQHEHDDTAGAAEFVAKAKDKTKAAVASTSAGELHDLMALDENIDDNEHNYTRFAVLSMNQQVVSEANKTSIILHTAHKPGALHDILGIFKEYSVNLTKIESRPIPGRDWHYVFYLDFRCEDLDTRAKIFSQLKHYDHDITVLGSYQAGTMPEL